MEVNDWNKVLVWFEVHEAHSEVNATITRCGAHVTEELHVIQNGCEVADGNYDPEAIIDSNIQPMIFPLHVTYNGEAVIYGLEGMGDTTLANSLCNKFKWMKDNLFGIKEHHHSEALDNSTGFFHIRGRELQLFSWSWAHHRKRGDGKRGTNITTHTISSKCYLMLFHEAENCNDIFDWVGTQRWIKTSGSSNGRGDVQFLVKRVDISFLRSSQFLVKIYI
uniref:Uncharacterized protein n=2 Tax=Cucumis melo TaxID=3656 RepID=A0A9I9CJ04_CUCME